MNNTNNIKSYKICVLYHYMYPDDVVSARHFDGFCEGLVERGWQVEALPCNRGCRDESFTYPLHSEHNGVSIRRIWRPAFKQHSFLGRLLNSFWMISVWSMIAFRRKSDLPDVMVVGTDPIFSVLVAVIIKKIRPEIRIAHWCYDLYPEAALADGIIKPGSTVVKIIKRVLICAYKSCDLIADLGCCMRNLLNKYGPTCRQVTLVPWALLEHDSLLEVNQQTRKELFGNAALGILYSGNFGRAHSYSSFIELARRLQGKNVHFCFSVRGNCAQNLHDALTGDDSNISFAEFASESELSNRLGAADIHIVSLKSEWTGVVVPSKFFGCLAAGRPVIFAGSYDSCIARWIVQHNVGWVLNESSVDIIATEITKLSTDHELLLEIQTRCHRVYQEHFSMRSIMDLWDFELRTLIR